MNGAPTAKPPLFNPKSPLLEEAGSQPPTSRILRESKSTISRPRGWQGQPEVINFLRLPPPVCVYFRRQQESLRLDGRVGCGSKCNSLLHLIRKEPGSY